MIGRVTEALSKVKGSLGSNERHALPGVIGDDLLRFGKLPLCLFICIIITGDYGGNDGAPYPVC
ncbi:Cell division protein FtsL [Raoultella terrigena]|uniref:Cell division protein FtsL n=1 Tax=Raoultella terrigena TaxID=577 RepID=A0A4U9DDA4_RAOTE|nr:Cell division protein FtsL [Raoultella terrigena]